MVIKTCLEGHSGGSIGVRLGVEGGWGHEMIKGRDYAVHGSTYQ